MKKSEIPLDLTGVVKKIELPEIKSMALFTINWMDIFSRPSKHYENPDARNESQMAGSALATELWMQIICCLDDKSLVFLIRTCKKFRNMTNDGMLRKRLYDYDRSAEILHRNGQLFAEFRSASLFPSVNNMPLPIIPIPYREVSFFPSAPHERRAYHDGPPGQGFTFY